MNANIPKLVIQTTIVTIIALVSPVCGNIVFAVNNSFVCNNA